MENNPQLLVYKASAGSGKTFTLAVEYIKHLIREPRAYRNILAVTFTNKATTEMKERILGQLYGIHTGDAEAEPYLARLVDDLHTDAATIRRAAGQALTLMIHDYSRFRVETIDSFFQSVMRNLARELELGANLTIELDNMTALSEAVDSLIEKLDRRSPVLAWLLDYIDERIESDRRWNVSGELKEFGRNIFNEEYIERGEALRHTLEDRDVIRRYRSTLRELEEEAVDQLKSFGRQFFDTLSLNGLSEDDLSNKKKGIASYFSKLMAEEAGDKIRNATVEKHLADPEAWVSKSNKKRAYILPLVESELLPLLITAEDFRRKNNRIINSCRLSLQHVNNVRLLADIDEEVRTLNQQQNRFLLADTNALLHGIVREGDPSFVFEKIGTHIRHVMIDEFQDTSRMQWANFKLLLMEGLAQGADSLIVGDVKQSIYRWRSGDWGILNSLRGRLGPFRIEEKTLNTNRRSEENIVRFNNELFTSACRVLNERHRAEQQEDCAPLLQAYSDVEQQVHKASGRGLVKLAFLPGKGDTDYREETLRRLAEEVESLHNQGVRTADMAILVRKNSIIPLIADYFDKHTAFRIVSDEAFRLDASLAVCMLMDALRYLSDPANRIAQAQLAAAYQNEVLKNDIDLNTLLLSEPDTYLPATFVEQQESLKLMPLYELLEKLFTLFGMERIGEQDAYLFSFFDVVTEYLKSHSSELTAFIAHWEEKLCGRTIPSGQIEGVRILSIHKSKGLEYPTVFIPFCDWKLENERPQNVWCAPQESPFSMLDLVPVTYGDAMNESVYHDDYLKERLQLWVDNLNLLYVAFTRPKANLIVWCKEGAKNTVSELLADAILDTSCRPAEPSDEADDAATVYTFGTLRPSGQQAEKAVSNKLLTRPTPLHVRMESLQTDIEFKQSNRSADFIQGEEDPDGKYIRQGELLHRLFSGIRTADDIPQALKRLRMEGVIASDEQEEQIRKLTVWALGHPRVKEWFSGDWELYNECAILYTENGEVQTRRPDRVMMKPDEVVVVDFKFGKKQAAYHMQVRQYMSLLAGMGYRHIRGYLWYVYNNELEEVK